MLNRDFRPPAFRRAAALLFALTLIWAMTAMPSAAQAAPYEDLRLIPLGRTTGIKMFAEGAMVVGFAELDAAGGVSPAEKAGLKLGDVIIAVNDTAVGSNEDLTAALAAASGPALTVVAKRDGTQQTYMLEAVLDADAGVYKIGAWVRDSIAGIGTITYVDPASGDFGALGHGISDADTGQLMDLSAGSLMASSVAGVKKGEPGEPGELTGEFDLTRNQGVLSDNTARGIFGSITRPGLYENTEALAIAPKADIETGPAQIISNVEGENRETYDIRIVKVYGGSDDSARDMMIEVTDPDLIAVTGGIVQGMSGSPIIQNGKLVGAVTHVLLNDPLRGYAIAIENMLAAAPH
jgi:stage IV sporulation protein B